jgi:hypothetical protein
MRANGRHYVGAYYTWPVILDRYCSFLERFTGRGAEPAGAQVGGKGVP